jgi:hypothetical protein
MEQERRKVCDPVTKFNFRWSHVSEGIIVLLLLGIIYQFIGMRDYIEWSKKFHDEIPDQFFTGKRWSFSDELKSQNQTNLQINTLDKRISLIEAQHRQVTDLLKSIDKAVKDK